MKKHADTVHNDIQTIAENVNGSSAVSGVSENLKPVDENSTPEKKIEQLTSREIEVLQFVATGKLNKQAASELCISVKTVEKHRQHLCSKLGIHGTAGLTHFAIYAGIIQCNPRIAMA